MFARKDSADFGASTTTTSLAADCCARPRPAPARSCWPPASSPSPITSIGVAATGNPLREGQRNGTTTRETEIVGNFGSSTGLKGGYVTRQSNLSSSGGGAVYGCRSQAGGSLATPTPQNPCIRANNLSRGLAFEFNSTIGDIVGAITVASGGDTKKPFVTNATGVATGLNADRVDNLDAAQIVAAGPRPVRAGNSTREPPPRAAVWRRPVPSHRVAAACRRQVRRRPEQVRLHGDDHREQLRRDHRDPGHGCGRHHRHRAHGDLRRRDGEARAFHLAANC